MKKYLARAAIISTALISLSTLPAAAQTVSTTTATSTVAATSSSPSTQDQIQALLAEISALKTQIAALISSNASLQGSVNQIQNVLQITSSLHQGMSGDGVKTLQSVLATDPTLFSSNNVTGYYGALTAEAVANFQKHFGLDAVGIVGPHTKEKLNELLKEHDVTNTRDLSENDLGDLGDSNENASSTPSAASPESDQGSVDNATSSSEHGDSGGHSNSGGHSDN